MTAKLQKLGRKLRFALLGTGVFSILALTLAALPILRGTIREDRTKLFVEKSTRALAETVSHYLDQYQQRMRGIAGALALARGEQPESLRVLNQAAREPVPGLLPHGIFDLLVLVRRDGTVEYTNSVGPREEPLDTAKLWGRTIGEFPE